MKGGQSAVRDILLYGSSIALVSGSNFAAVPILLALLGDREFARWALLEPILLAALPLAGLGIQIALLRDISLKTEATDPVAQLLPLHASTSATVAGVAGLGAFLSGYGLQLALLLAFIVTLEGLMVFFTGLWRATERPLLYSLIEGGRAASITLVLALALATGANVATVQGYMLLRLAAVALAICIAISVVRPRFAKLDFRAGLNAVRYGLPIVVASSLSAILLNIDRYALTGLGAREIATYVAHSRAVQLALLVGTAFYTWFVPKAIYAMNNIEDGRFFLLRSTSAFILFIIFTAQNMYYFVPFFWPYVFPDVPLNTSLLAIQIVSMAALSTGNPLSISVLRNGKTYQAVLVTISAIFVAAVASFALALYIGGIGAAIGRALGAITYSVLFGAVTTTALRLIYPWPKYIVAALVVIVTIVLLDSAVVGTDRVHLALKWALANVVSVPILLVLFRSARGSST